VQTSRVGHIAAEFERLANVLLSRGCGNPAFITYPHRELPDSCSRSPPASAWRFVSAFARARAARAPQASGMPNGGCGANPLLVTPQRKEHR
jgi:hypothetical protein